MVGFEVGTESLVGVADEFSFIHESLVEGVKNFSLDVSSVEFGLLLLVLSKLLAHVLVQSFLFAFNLALDSVISLLLLNVLTFNFLELSTECA